MGFLLGLSLEVVRDMHCQDGEALVLDEGTFVVAGGFVEFLFVVVDQLI